MSKTFISSSQTLPVKYPLSKRDNPECWKIAFAADSALTKSSLAPKNLDTSVQPLNFV